MYVLISTYSRYKPVFCHFLAIFCCSLVVSLSFSPAYISCVLRSECQGTPGRGVLFPHVFDIRLIFVLQADADDIDTWMLDILRIVSSVDVGHDEFSTQALVKKHKDVAEEIGSYRPVIDALHEQSCTFPPDGADSEAVNPPATQWLSVYI